MKAKTYSSLAIPHCDDLIFGKAPHPVKLRNGLTIGGGSVYPELNFTLPAMEITESTMPEVLRQYSEMIDGACRRAGDLHTPGLIVEFELLPPLTLVPEWGAEVTKVLRERLDRLQAEHPVKVGLRVTPNDIREFERPPMMRSGEYVDKMYRSFELCARAGADLLAIESTGGKELHDEALISGDLELSVFSLGILGSRDMACLWDRIVQICHETGTIPSGDSACGFGNTAMVLADQRQIPKVWAAVVRVLTVARSLVAHERGAVGPGKDCAYESIYLKAITGYPIALEGAEAACAHLSAIGNIAKAAADLWSNESVQNVKLLSAMAPLVSLEQLIYAVRLMNAASADGPAAARQLRDWFVKSDCGFDPQAYVLRPDVVVRLAASIVEETTPYLRTRRAALETLALLRSANHEGEFSLSKTEIRWLDRLSRQADVLPADESEFIASIRERIDVSKVRLDQYGLGSADGDHYAETGEDLAPAVTA
jgi:methanol--5-hydroxybenzimidazolylcobamide Co-methyltransferase